jgi:hypothetical protein
MNPNEHEEWQAMKIQWKSTSVAEMLMTQQLRWGLRLRMLGSWVWLGTEIAALLLITFLGIIQVAMGQAAVGSCTSSWRWSAPAHRGGRDAPRCAAPADRCSNSWICRCGARGVAFAWPGRTTS